MSYNIRKLIKSTYLMETIIILLSIFTTFIVGLILSNSLYGKNIQSGTFLITLLVSGIGTKIMTRLIKYDKIEQKIIIILTLTVGFISIIFVSVLLQVLIILLLPYMSYDKLLKYYNELPSVTQLIYFFVLFVLLYPIVSLTLSGIHLITS